jgi:hypothetical protein
MLMRDFSTTASCQARTLCRECRDTSPAGDAWRAEFARLSIIVPAVCPHGVDGQITPVAVAAVAAAAPEHFAQVDPRLPLFQSLWAELHTRTDADTAYIESFTRRVPCGDCRSHWKLAMWVRPPVFGDGYFEWSVEIHNKLNIHLGKPTVELEVARARWLDQAQIEPSSTAV